MKLTITTAMTTTTTTTTTPLGGSRVFRNSNFRMFEGYFRGSRNINIYI